MQQNYHDASQEIGDIPAMVCLEHGAFIPCRKQGEHRVSSDPRDIELVRYHQEVSSRLQNYGFRYKDRWPEEPSEG